MAKESGQGYSLTAFFYFPVTIERADTKKVLSRD